MDAKQRIARRVAQELRDGDIVNLGIGLPTMVANYLPADIHITLQSENGFERGRSTVRYFAGRGDV